jgi:predicted RNase H-like HicB family nuclease
MIEHRYSQSVTGGLLAIVLVVLWISCGTIRNTDNYRWLVKTTTDADSARVVYSFASPTTVAAQTHFVTPANLTQASTRQSSEDSVFVLEAYLVALKIEPDNDYHLIIRDLATDSTMLAEIPDPAASWTTRSSRSEQFRMARSAIDTLVGPPTSSLRHLAKPMKLRITGIGFFDPEHFSLSHEGMAANRREIHPVLGVEGAR